MNQNQSVGELLGYDVIDTDIGSISGLSNCDINWRIAEQCGPLNQHHLFSNYNHAECFRDLADKRVEEHAPFAVWKICQLR